jgi:hypothetical protein
MLPVKEFFAGIREVLISDERKERAYKQTPQPRGKLTVVLDYITPRVGRLCAGVSQNRFPQQTSPHFSASIHNASQKYGKTCCTPRRGYYYQEGEVIGTRGQQPAARHLIVK